MGDLGSSPGWGLGRLGLERATLRTSPYGMASEGQESRFPDRSKGHRDDVILHAQTKMNEKNQEKQSARRKVFFPNDSENRKGGRLSEVNRILKVLWIARKGSQGLDEASFNQLTKGNI